MRNKPLTPLQLVALSDLSMIVMVAWWVAWSFAYRILPVWGELVVLGVVYLLHRRYARRFVALTRLAYRLSRTMSPTERRRRYHWHCGMMGTFTLLVAWILPFAVTTAAYWCIFLTFLVFMVAAHESAREGILRNSSPSRATNRPLS